MNVIVKNGTRMVALIVMLCCTVAFSGCSFGAFTVDTLLSAPKLSREQQEIHESLIASVGSDITLKYPKSGDNRSAFLIADIDDEPTDEAIVFYEYNNISKDNGGIRLCVLDKNDNGKWKCVYEQAGAGTDVDRIFVSQMDRSGKINIIVGYSTMSINEKALEIYTYENGKLRTETQDTYCVLETLDINNDGYNEIVTVQSAGENTPATASLLGFSNGEIVKQNMISMTSQFQNVVSFTKGKVTSKNKALFVDCSYAEGQIRTEFIYYRHNALQNPVAQIGDRLMLATVRPEGYYSADVDGDGIIEIPTVKAMTGYELLSADEQLYMTTWYAYEDFYRFTEKLTGYYSVSNGYMLEFPENWLNSVTVKRDQDTGEAVFYKYDTALENSKIEIMRIAVSSREMTEEYLLSGYERITSVGQIDYLVKLSGDKRNDKVPDLKTVKNSFYVVS